MAEKLKLSVKMGFYGGVTVVYISLIGIRGYPHCSIASPARAQKKPLKRQTWV